METAIIELDAFEWWQAAQAGLSRQIKALKKGRKDAHGFKGDGWGVHIEGACAEAAVAKYLGVWWSGDFERLYGGDVANKVEVRSTHHARGALIMHDTDFDDRPYVLLRGKAPKFNLVGWVWGREGKVKRHWRDPGTGRPAYFIGDGFRPIETLIEVLNK